MQELDYRDTEAVYKRIAELGSTNKELEDALVRTVENDKGHILRMGAAEAKVKELLEALEGVKQYAHDTLSGPVDCFETPAWHREGWREAARRAQAAIDKARGK